MPSGRREGPISGAQIIDRLCTSNTDWLTSAGSAGASSIKMACAVLITCSAILRLIGPKVMLWPASLLRCLMARGTRCPSVPSSSRM